MSLMFMQFLMFLIAVWSISNLELNEFMTFRSYQIQNQQRVKKSHNLNKNK